MVDTNTFTFATPEIIDFVL